MKLKLMTLVATAGLLIAFSGATMAQVKTEPGVARISMIHGDVSTQRGDSGDWGAAALNAPVVEGDRIQTGETSRVEVQLDYANILRLAERAQANIKGLSRTQIQVQLGQGLANYSVLKNSDADVEIDTPNMSLHPTRREGNYRIFVLSDQETQIQIRKGEADVATPQGRTHVSKGQLIVVRGTGDDTLRPDEDGDMGVWLARGLHAFVRVLENPLALRVSCLVADGVEATPSLLKRLHELNATMALARALVTMPAMIIIWPFMLESIWPTVAVALRST